MWIDDRRKASRTCIEAQQLQWSDRISLHRYILYTGWHIRGHAMLFFALLFSATRRIALQHTSWSFREDTRLSASSGSHRLVFAPSIPVPSTLTQKHTCLEDRTFWSYGRDTTTVINSRALLALQRDFPPQYKASTTRVECIYPAISSSNPIKVSVLIESKIELKFSRTKTWHPCRARLGSVSDLFYLPVINTPLLISITSDQRLFMQSACQTALFLSVCLCPRRSGCAWTDMCCGCVYFIRRLSKTNTLSAPSLTSYPFSSYLFGYHVYIDLS